MNASCNWVDLFGSVQCCERALNARARVIKRSIYTARRSLSELSARQTDSVHGDTGRVVTRERAPPTWLLSPNANQSHTNRVV